MDKGLRNTEVGFTRITEIFPEDVSLFYRGYKIDDFVKEATYEELVYLLLYEKLPVKMELDNLLLQLRKERILPERLKNMLEQIPKESHPVEVLQIGIMLLGILLPEQRKEEVKNIVLSVLAKIPAMLAYWYHYTYENKRIATQSDAVYLADYFYKIVLPDCEITEEKIRLLNIALLLYAEHGFNASAFAARICAGAQSDIYACLLAGLTTLKGVSHGGAIEAAFEGLKKIPDASQVPEILKKMLDRKERIMGFGHAIYTIKDPRADIIKEELEKRIKQGEKIPYFDIAKSMEKYMWDTKKILANTDLYHAVAFHYLGIPSQFYTCIFALARVVGWSAHIIEQRNDNKLIRPKAKYLGNQNLAWISLKNRSL